MRKIEEKMNEAIMRGSNLYCGNTIVETNNGVSKVYLHGVHIANATPNWVQITNMEHHPCRFSHTTSSRVNALLERYNVRLHFSDKYGTIKYDDGTNFEYFTTFHKQYGNY